MRKKMVGVAAALALGYFAAQASSAAQNHPMSTMASRHSVIAGTIAAVDARANMLKLKTGLLFTQQFAVAAEAPITGGQQRLALENLKPGQRVEVEYVTDERGQRVARAIQLKSAAK